MHPLIEANPDLQVVIDHMADSPLDQPEKLELLLALARYPKVFVKISHMWSLSNAGLSLSRRSRPGEAALRCLRRRSA